MVKTGKSWREKLEKTAGLPKIVDIPKKMEKRLGRIKLSNTFILIICFLLTICFLKEGFMSQIFPKEISLEELIKESQFVFLISDLGSETKEAIFKEFDGKESKFIRTIYNYAILEKLFPKSKKKLVENRIGVIQAYEDEYQMKGKSFYVKTYNSYDKNAYDSKEKIIFLRYNSDKKLFEFTAEKAYEGKSEKKKIIKLIRNVKKIDPNLKTYIEHLIMHINSISYMGKIEKLGEIKLPNEWYDLSADEKGKVRVGILERVSKENKGDNLFKHIKHCDAPGENCDWCEKEIPRELITVTSLKSKEYLILNGLEIHKVKDHAENLSEHQLKTLKKIFSD